MARYEHLPIFREAYDLTVHIEKIVRNFSRYHKYTLGTDLRNKSRKIVEKIIEANNAEDRAAHLLELRQELESFKVLARICHESGGFASTRSYLHVAERITNIARQNEGWLKKAQGKGRRRQKPEQVDGAKRSEPQPSQLGLGLAPQSQTSEVSETSEV